MPEKKIDNGNGALYNKDRLSKREIAFRLVSHWLERKTRGDIVLRFDGTGRDVSTIEAREVI